MSEFIVWDNKYKGFLNENISLLPDGISTIPHFDINNVTTKRFETFNFIGKKDSNKNKIYADCSIIEFNFENKKLIGYFHFEKKSLAYDIRVLNNNIYSIGYAHFNNKIKKLKIIDTIQENKLELIKEE